jgi:hypothetical protein
MQVDIDSNVDVWCGIPADVVQSNPNGLDINVHDVGGCLRIVVYGVKDNGEIIADTPVYESNLEV